LFQLFHRPFFPEEIRRASKISFQFLLLFPGPFLHCLFVEATTIAFQAYALTSLSGRRAIARTVARPPEMPPETWATRQNSGKLRLTCLQVPPFESHPVDRLLPQSRLQQMKRLLERA